MSVLGDALVGVFLGGGGVVGAAVGAEVIGSSRWLSRRLIHRASRRVPERRRETRREEWFAEWDAFDGADLSRLLWALGVYVGAQRMAVRGSRASRAATREPAPTDAGSETYLQLGEVRVRTVSEYSSPIGFRSDDRLILTWDSYAEQLSKSRIRHESPAVTVEQVIAANRGLLEGRVPHRHSSGE
ncbi:hypothetical protein GCM10028783_37090 [Modestobacter muralis]